jgi:hypothetical protein
MLPFERHPKQQVAVFYDLGQDVSGVLVFGQEPKEIYDVARHLKLDRHQAAVVLSLHAPPPREILRPLFSSGAAWAVLPL